MEATLPARLARYFTLAAAGAATIVLIEYPWLVAGGRGLLPRGVLWLTMIGICMGFVYGFGIRPRRPWLAGLVGPWVAWPLMATLLLLLPWHSA